MKRNDPSVSGNHVCSSPGKNNKVNEPTSCAITKSKPVSDRLTYVVAVDTCEKKRRKNKKALAQPAHLPQKNKHLKKIKNNQLRSIDEIIIMWDQVI